MSLTKDTEKAFKIIYCEYRRLRKSGFAKQDAQKFDDGKIPEISAFSNWLAPDIDSAIKELKSSDYLKEDIIGDITITDEGIKYMENKPKEFFNDLSALFDLASLFLPF